MITIVIPTYNRCSLIKKYLVPELLKQKDFDKFTFIFCDNCSKDNTQNYLELLKKNIIILNILDQIKEYKKKNLLLNGLSKK
jgi:glycosyltransferase involved in cell wall biosynthesis